MTKQINNDITIGLTKLGKRTDEFEIHLEMDMNDGDYVRSCNSMSKEDFIALYPILVAIKNGEYTSTGECKRDDYEVPDDLEDLWFNYIPSSEYGGHNLEITRLTYFDEDGVEYGVSL